MRYAILTDPHGNPFGLDAVLADIQAKGGVDSCILLGDYTAIGPDPVGVLERIAALPQAICVSGNTDTAVINVPFPASVEFNASLGWTRGCLTQAGWYDWLAALPVEQHLTLPDGTAVLGVHASPGTNDGPGLQPVQTDDDVLTLFGQAAESLILVGHTHVPQERRINGKHIVNVGSIGNPFGKDTSACYGLLDANADGYTLTLHRAAYDVSPVLKAIDTRHYPDPSYIRKFYLGEFEYKW
jgi:predicted phosphodiesterase